MKRPDRYSLLGRALDEWSDIAITTWVLALRLALALAVMVVFAIWNGRFHGDWDKFWGQLPYAGLFLFGLAFVCAIILRLERLFSKERKLRRTGTAFGRIAQHETRDRKRDRAFRKKAKRNNKR
jgi:ABC-type multidrug transport system fused ATPase/permease subunit